MTSTWIQSAPLRAQCRRFPRRARRSRLPGWTGPAASSGRNLPRRSLSLIGAGQHPRVGDDVVQVNVGRFKRNCIRSLRFDGESDGGRTRQPGQRPIVESAPHTPCARRYRRTRPAARSICPGRASRLRWGPTRRMRRVPVRSRATIRGTAGPRPAPSQPERRSYCRGPGRPSSPRATLRNRSADNRR